MLLLAKMTEDWKKQNVEREILGLVVSTHDYDGGPLADGVEHWLVRSIV